FDQVPRDVLERRIDRQERERRVDVRQRQHDGKWAVQEELNGPVRDVQVLQEGVQHAVAPEDGLPGVPAHQVARAQGNDHELVEQLLPLQRIKRKVVGERVTEQE